MMSVNDKNALSKFQKGDEIVIKRSELKEAVYNPRIIDEPQMKRLKAGLKEHGLIGASIVWNRQTGNIVSGHQRLKALDMLEGSQDYDLRVTVIDVDVREEKKLNVQLNNSSMMGEWDIEKLGDLFEEENFSADDLGFTDLDIDIMFNGDERFSELFHDNEGVAASKEEIRAIREHRKESMEKMKEEQSGNFYFTVVCESEEDKKLLLREMSHPVGETFVSSDHVRRLRMAEAERTKNKKESSTELIIPLVSEDQKNVILDKIESFIESEGLTGDFTRSRAIEYMLVNYEENTA